MQRKFVIQPPCCEVDSGQCPFLDHAGGDPFCFVDGAFIWLSAEGGHYARHPACPWLSEPIPVTVGEP